MVNRYKGKCHYCNAMVPAKGGNLFKVGRRWKVAHLSCESSGESRVMVTRFSSGEEVYRNSQGRCEDAPCCGCCS